MALVIWYPMIKNAENYAYGTNEIVPENLKTYAKGQIYQNTISPSTSFSSSCDQLNTKEITVSFWVFNKIRAAIDKEFPDDYIELEYIESNGNQYINMFNINLNVNGKLTVGYKFMASEHTDAMYFSTITSDQSKGQAYSLGYTGPSSDMYIRWNQAQNIETRVDYRVGEICEVTRTNEVQAYLQSCSLFAHGGSYKPWKGRIYHYWLKIGDTYIFDLIPVIRKSDNVIGLYDKTNGVFHVNNGSGSFVAGPAVELPSEYQQVEYIGQTGTQCINLGFVPAADYAYELDYTDTSASGSNYVLGSREGLSGTIYGGLSGAIANQNVTINKHSTKTGNDYRKKNYRYIGKATYTSDSKGISSLTCVNTGDVFTGTQTLTNEGATEPLYVCGQNTQRVHNGMLIHSLKLWQQCTLIRDLVPCYRIQDNKPGLYDMVNRVFYTNNGTGEFTLGPDVEVQQTVFSTTCSYGQDVSDFTIRLNESYLVATCEYFGLNVTQLKYGWNHVVVRLGYNFDLYVNGELNRNQLVDPNHNYSFDKNYTINFSNVLVQDFKVFNHCLSEFELDYHKREPVVKYKFDGSQNNYMYPHFDLTSSYTSISESMINESSIELTTSTKLISDELPKLDNCTLVMWIYATTSDQEICTYNSRTFKTTYEIAISRWIMLAIEIKDGKVKESVNASGITPSFVMTSDSDSIGGFTGKMCDFRIIPATDIDLSMLNENRAVIDNLGNIYVHKIKCTGVYSKEVWNSGFINENGDITESQEYPNASYTDLIRVEKDTLYIFNNINNSIRIFEYDQYNNFIDEYSGYASGRYSTVDTKLIRLMMFDGSSTNKDSFYFYDEADEFADSPSLVDSRGVLQANNIGEYQSNTAEAEIYKNLIMGNKFYED